MTCSLLLLSLTPYSMLGLTQYLTGLLGSDLPSISISIYGRYSASSHPHSHSVTMGAHTSYHIEPEDKDEEKSILHYVLSILYFSWISLTPVSSLGLW
jgi:hypothetical protein